MSNLFESIVFNNVCNCAWMPAPADQGLLNVAQSVHVEPAPENMCSQEFKANSMRTKKNRSKQHTQAPSSWNVFFMCSARVPGVPRPRNGTSDRK